MPQTMARNVLEVSNSLNDTSKKTKCFYVRILAADWDDTNSTADDVMHSDAFVYSTANV